MLYISRIKILILILLSVKINIFALSITNVISNELKVVGRDNELLELSKLLKKYGYVSI